MELLDIIKQKLESALEPLDMKMVDHSAAHAGHSGNPSGSAHIELWIVSQKFEGQTELSRQRMVFKVLDDEMKSSIHALIIHAKSPNEPIDSLNRPLNTESKKNSTRLLSLNNNGSE